MGMEVPYDKLSPEALDGVIKEFILREGTDYGVREWTFEDKVEQVRSQLHNGTAKIVFDPISESCSIIEKF